MIKYLRVLPVIIVVVLCIYEVSLYRHDFSFLDTSNNNQIYIEEYGTVNIDFLWNRNNMLIVNFSDNSDSNTLNYAFFKKGIVGKRYKLIKAVKSNTDIAYDVVEVENVLINITIKKDQIIENKIVIEHDWRQSDFFMILVYFLAFNFIFNNKYIRNLKSK